MSTENVTAHDVLVAGLDAIAAFDEGIDDVVAGLIDISDELDLADRARLGDALDRLRRRAADASAWADDQLNAAMAATRRERLDDIPGLPPIERLASKGRRGWDNDALRTTALGRLHARAAAEAAAEDGDGLIDPDTGARVPGWSHAIAAVTDVWNLAGGNARVTALKHLGIDPDEYCTPGGITWNVRYVRD